MLFQGEDSPLSFGTMMRARGSGINAGALALPAKTGEILPFLLSIKDGVNTDAGIFASYEPEWDFLEFSIADTEWYLDFGGNMDIFYPGSFRYELTRQPLDALERYLPGALIPDEKETRQIVSNALDQKTPIAFGVQGGIRLYSDDIALKNWGQMSFSLSINGMLSKYPWGSGKNIIGSLGVKYTPN